MPSPGDATNEGKPIEADSETSADSQASADSELSEEAAVRRFEWVLGKNLERRIDQYLVDRVGYLSRNEVQQLIEAGLVTVNGRAAKASYRPKLNDVVRLEAPPPRAATIAGEDIPLDIIYEDDHLIALNKQSNLIVHPARGVWNGTLVNALVYYGNIHGHTWSTVNGAWRPGILHRLDRNTTGVMLVAKSDEAHWRLARQFENRSIQKTYLAIAHGVPALKADVIDLPIGHDKFVREKMAVRRLESGAKEAVTKYEVIEPIESATETFAFIKLTPKTGRTHQLRVHLSHIGHPIVGDTTYGGKVVESRDGSFRFERQALHAFEITFTHPATLLPMTLGAPLRDDMLALYRCLKDDSHGFPPI
jgi:23S rRNA pseudouridine1911/1915/1917 synthase